MIHPWHGIEPGKLAPELVDCVIEVPRGSRNKYELDKMTGLLRLDRVLYSAVFYPANYGFIPRTYCDDRDPLDILVLGYEPVVPMCILTARPIGVMQMVDQNEEDDKIIAIHENDPAMRHYQDISDLPTHTLEELQRFFEDYKILERKKVRIERFKGRVDAHEIIRNSMLLYDQSYAPDGSKRPDAPVLASELRDDTPAGSGRTPSRNALADAARRQGSRLHEKDQLLVESERGLSNDPSATEEVPEKPTLAPIELNGSTQSPKHWAIDERTLGAYSFRAPAPAEDSGDAAAEAGDART